MELLLHWQHFFFYGQTTSKQIVTPAPQIEPLELADAVVNEKYPETASADIAETTQKKTSNNEEAEKVIVRSGMTLRILAEEKLGNREFWVYIYMKNHRRINNPNRVPIGTELFIPEKSEYDMNAADAEAVVKAKKIGDRILREWS